jgi:hypothetical protein
LSDAARGLHTALVGNADLVRRALEDFFAYDDSSLLDLISTDAEWHGVDSDPCDCRGREKLMTRLRDCRTKGFLTALVEVRDGADSGWPIDEPRTASA